MNAMQALVTVLLFLFFLFYYTKEKKVEVYHLLPIQDIPFFFFKRNSLPDLSFLWSSPLYVQINQFITGRLALGNHLFIPLNWFGAKRFSLLNRRKHRVILNYNYVDSSYVQMLFYTSAMPYRLLISQYLCHCSKYEFKKGVICCDLALVPCCMIEAFWFVPT